MSLRRVHMRSSGHSLERHSKQPGGVIECARLCSRERIRKRREWRWLFAGAQMRGYVLGTRWIYAVER